MSFGTMNGGGWDFRQPQQSWFPNATAPKGAPPRRMLRWLANRTWLGLAKNPYTQSEQTLNAADALEKQKANAAIQNTNKQMAQQAAQLGTTYNGVAQDAARARTDTINQQLAEASTKRRLGAVETNRDRLMQVLTGIGNKRNDDFNRWLARQNLALAAQEANKPPLEAGGGMYG